MSATAVRNLLLFTLIAAVIGLVVVGSVLFGKETPSPIVAGPIYADRGMVGPVTAGMSRNDLIELYGQPLRPRDSEPEKHFDAELKDYFGGLYADVQCSNRDKVLDIVYKFDQFERRYKSELEVILCVEGAKPVVLSRTLSYDDARDPKWLRRLGVDVSQVVVGATSVSIRFPGSGTVSMYFDQDDSSLRYVYYMFSKKQEK